jgi:hypothetical protein
MIERDSRFGPGRWAHQSLAVTLIAVAASVATYPEAILLEARAVLVQCEKSVEQAIVSRELNVLAGMLDCDRIELRRVEKLRDVLAVRFQALQDRRFADEFEAIPASCANDDARDRSRRDPGCADLDGATLGLRTTIVRAEHDIDAARRLIRARETRLRALQAMMASQRASRELAELDGDIPGWEGRARLVSELLGSACPAAHLR